MSKNMVTAKFEVVFPFDIALEETEARQITVVDKSGAVAVIHPPEKADVNKLQKGRLGSSLFIDITRDIDTRKPGEDFMGFFLMPMYMTLYKFRDELLHTCEITWFDCQASPIYTKCNYCDSSGAPVFDPETGKSYFELSQPNGVVINSSEWEQISKNTAEWESAYRGESVTMLLEAKYLQHTERNDLSIMLAAIVCEYEVKQACTELALLRGIKKEFWDALVEKIHPRVLQYFDSIIVSLGAHSLENSRDKKLRQLHSRLRELFRDRNRIVHFGNVGGYNKILDLYETTQIARRHIDTAEEVIKWLQTEIEWLETQI